MADLDIRPTDLVVIRLALRGRDGGDAITLDESVRVSDLGDIGGDGAAGGVPEFDNAAFANLMASNDPADRERGLQLMAAFHEQTAEFVAGGGTPPAESLAGAVVDWVLATQPKGHKYTNNPDGDGYVISTEEINIAGPVEVGEDRLWRVTAVGTWG